MIIRPASSGYTYRVTERIDYMLKRRNGFTSSSTTAGFVSRTTRPSERSEDLLSAGSHGFSPDQIAALIVLPSWQADHER